jgi:hypothetical protein
MSFQDLDGTNNFFDAMEEQATLAIFRTSSGKVLAVEDASSTR